MVYLIPFTIIPLIVFNIVAMIFGAEVWNGTVFELTMISGAAWRLTVGDLMIVAGLAFLYAEVMKSTRAAGHTITNHVLSTVVLIVYIVEFIVAGIAANSTFFILTLMALFDVIAGFSISIKTASRDVSLDPPVMPGQMH